MTHQKLETSQSLKKMAHEGLQCLSLVKGFKSAPLGWPKIAMIVSMVVTGAILTSPAVYAGGIPVTITVAPNPATIGTAPNTNPNDVMAADGTATKSIIATVTPVKTTDTLPADAKVTFTTSIGSIASPVTVTNGTATTTLTAAAAAGTATVTASIVDSTGTKSATTTIYMIGGPITGDADKNYYCRSDWSPTGHLSGVAAQPTGTTETWTMTGPATLLNPNYPTTSWVGNTASYVGTGPSAAPVGRDVTATLKYSLHGTDVTNIFKITIHEPTSLPLEGPGGPNPTTPTVYYPDDPGGPGDNTKVFGFDDQIMTYRVYDQFTKPMAAVSWSEEWLGPHRSANLTFPEPESRGSGADADGFIHDYHAARGYNETPLLTLTRPHSTFIYSFDTHNFWIGKGTNGEGCLLLTHSNVTYNTNGVTGD